MEHKGGAEEKGSKIVEHDKKWVIAKWLNNKLKEML